MFFFKKKIDFVIIFIFVSINLSRFHDVGHGFFRVFFLIQVFFIIVLFVFDF